MIERLKIYDEDVVYAQYENIFQDKRKSGLDLYVYVYEKMSMIGKD